MSSSASSTSTRQLNAMSSYPPPGRPGSQHTTQQLPFFVAAWRIASLRRSTSTASTIVSSLSRPNLAGVCSEVQPWELFVAHKRCMRGAGEVHPSQASLEVDEAGCSMITFLKGSRSRPSGAHHASEGWTVSARLPALLEDAGRVVPFIACAIGISCARSCIMQCPMSDARSPRMQLAPIVMGS